MITFPLGVVTYLSILWFFKNEECRTVQQYLVSRGTLRKKNSS